MREGVFMSTYPEPTPLDQPFPGAAGVLRRELEAMIGNFFYRFEHEKQSKSTMSHLLRLYETMFLSRSKEVGGKIYQEMQHLMQVCADFANGHGKIGAVYKHLEQIRADLRSSP